MPYTKSQAKKAKGSVLQIGDGATPEVFTTIAEVTTIKQSGAKFDEVDVTNMESLAKEFQAGMEDSGTLQLAMSFVNDATQTSLKSAKGTVVNFVWQFPTLATPKKLTFAALVQSVNLDVDPKNVLKATCDLHISGAVVEAALP